MPYYNFRQDLPIAKKTEEEVADMLKRMYGYEILAFENTNKYDVLVRLVTGEKKKIEIKEDFTGETTGNVGLEFECRGKPSGIQVTEADYYIYKLHTKNNGIQYVLHLTDTLRTMIKEHRYFRIVNGGDKGSNSMNYLFKYEEFIKDGKLL